MHESGKTSLFVVNTNSTGTLYSQLVAIKIDSTVSALPVVGLSCRVPSLCYTYGNYKTFSSSNTMIFTGSYSYNGSSVDSVSYTWTVYKNLGNTTTFDWSELNSDEKAYLTGKFFK